DMLTSMGIYAILVLIVYGVALGTSVRGEAIVRISGGLIWALVVFTSLLGLNRSFAHERENGSLEGILLVPLDRGAIYLAKACANAIFLVGVEIITIPAFWFLFLIDAPVAHSAWLIIPVLIVGTIGIAGVGTLMSTITMHTRGRDVMLAVLLIPVIFPLLYACVSTTGAALMGAVDWQNTVMIGLALGVGYDVVMVLVSWLLYDFVVSV
ncbi:MAG: heme exporter protein CcmB, partial [Eggerthellaceae bacterium]|nr:heme exporter protein CcmB [Eggerthellaceae bacterium]